MIVLYSAVKADHTPTATLIRHSFLLWKHPSLLAFHFTSFHHKNVEVWPWASKEAPEMTLQLIFDFPDHKDIFSARKELSGKGFEFPITYERSRVLVFREIYRSEDYNMISGKAKITFNF